MEKLKDSINNFMNNALYDYHLLDIIRGYINKHNIVIEFSHDGISYNSYSDGQKHGICKFYNHSSKDKEFLEQKELYFNDELICSHFYDEHMKIETIMKKIDTKRYQIKIFNINGILIRKQYTKNGMLHGKCFIYNYFGKLKELFIYRKGYIKYTYNYYDNITIIIKNISQYHYNKKILYDNKLISITEFYKNKKFGICIKYKYIEDLCIENIYEYIDDQVIKEYYNIRYIL